MRRARGECDRISRGVGGFDAEHVRPFIVTKIGHRLCLGDPGVPDDGRIRAGLFDEDLAGPGGIGDGRCIGGVEIDAISFAFNGDGAGLRFLLRLQNAVLSAAFWAAGASLTVDAGRLQPLLKKPAGSWICP